MLLATVRPSHLLRGKIFGIGLLGLAQLVLIGVVGFVTAQVVGTLDFPSEAIATTIYSRALLRTGRVRIRQVLRSREA